MFKGNYFKKFSIRKLSVGVASVAIGLSFIAGDQSVAFAQEVKAKDISYQYVTLSELSQEEKQRIISSLPTDKVDNHDIYYMVYQPQQMATLPRTGATSMEFGMALGMGSLVIGLLVSKKKRKYVVASLLFISATGTLTVSAIEGVKLAAYNQSFTLSIGDVLPQTVIEIPNYTFVGYILEDIRPDEYVPSIEELKSNPDEVKSERVVEEKPQPITTVTRVSEEIISEDVEIIETDALFVGETQEVPGVSGERIIDITEVTEQGTVIERTQTIVSETLPIPKKVYVGRKVPNAPTVQLPEAEIVTEEIAYETHYQADDEKELNTKETVTPGSVGTKETATIYYPTENDREIVSQTETVTDPVTEVVSVGTQPTTRVEETPYDTTYKADENQAVGEKTVETAGVNAQTEYTTTYHVNETTGEVSANPETSTVIVEKTTEVVSVGTQPTTRTETIPYTIAYEDDATKEMGIESVKTEGENGEKQYRTTYALKDNTSDALVATEEVTSEREPVTRTIVRGSQPKVITRVINYVNETGEVLHDPARQEVTFVKEIVSTDTVTGLSKYSDWQTTSNQLASVTSPEISKYHTENKVVSEAIVTPDSDNQVIDVVYKPNIIETEDKKVITRTIRYLYEDTKQNVFDPVVQEVVYTRAKYTNEVTGEVTVGDWTSTMPDFTEKISPEKEGYTASLDKVELVTTTPESEDSEVSVLYTDKFIEVKDVDTASLYFSLEDSGYTRIMALDTLPTEYSKYYVKVNSDQFKDLQLSVKSISLDTVSGKEVYKVVATHPKLKQDEKYDGYEEDYTIYVAKADQTLQGIRTFRELLEKVKANPADTLVLANDISADGIDLTLKDTAYIADTFTGSLSGKNGEKHFAIYDLKAPLFNVLGKAAITDLAFKNVNIDANHYDTVGALARKADGATIKNVVVQGNLAASNNYGAPDSGNHGPGKIVLGGIVGEAVNSKLENNTFTGTLNGDSTGIRYFVNNNFSTTELLVGGIAGSANNATITRNNVSANIHVNAIDGVAINWAKGILGNPLYAGALVGSAGNGIYTDNYVEGKIVNQLENQKTVYGDGVDRSAVFGNVGGLFGNIGRTTVKDNITAVTVTNGAVVNSSGEQLNQMVVEGIANGDKPNRGATRSVTSDTVQPRKDAIKTALELSDQYINNAFDVDYTQVKGYNAAYDQAYRNVEKLLPFYNRAFIVKEANKLAASDKLVTHQLLSVTPMKDSAVISDVSGDKEAINKILLHYADHSVEYKDVVYKEEFKDTHIAEYTVNGVNIAYTTDQFVDSYEKVVAAVKDELAAVSYTGDEIWQALSLETAKNETKIRELYLEDRFNDIQANLEKVLKNVLGTSTAYSNTQDVVQYIKQNKAELLLGLSYVSRWFNIDFNTTNIQSLITYQPDFFGKQVSTLEWLVEVGSAGYRALDPKVTDEKAASLVGETNNTESLHDLLESYRAVFAPEKSFEEWFNQSVKAYVAIGKAFDNTGKEIGNSDLYHQLTKRMTSVNWDRSAANIDFSNAILPLLTARKDKVYIISTGSSIQFGAIHTYVDRTLETSNPDEYTKQLTDIKATIDRVANNQAKHWEAWYAIANENVRDRLVSNKPVSDTLYVKTATSREWPEKFGANAPEAVKDFFGPLGRIGGKPNPGQEGWSDGTNIGYTGAVALNEAGESIWTHEQVHNWDGSVYLGGYGRRVGANMEAYAEGLLQSPRSDYGRIRGVFALNMTFDNTNKFPEYNSSPERFQSAADLKEFAKGMMDTLYVLDYAEAVAISKLNTATQAKLLSKLTANAKTANVNTDKFIALSEDDLRGMDLTKIDTFIENNLARSYGVRESDISVTHYQSVPMFAPFYGLSQNDNGISGPYTFKRTSFEMLAEYGYQGFVDYASGRYKTDTEAVNAIFNGTYANLTEFKKEMFKKRIARLPQLKPITVTFKNKEYKITNAHDLQTAMDTIVQSGNGNDITNFKREVYVAYMKETNEFKSEIFK